MLSKAGDLVVSTFLVLISGFVSGMTVGLLSIDSVQLRVLQDQGTAYQRNKAKQLEKILSNHHLILVTLLLANSIALEALPLFLTKCVSEVAAVALSVTLILLFGEIIPQALCTGKHQIAIVMNCLSLVQFLISVLWFLSYPIARLLDCLVGHSEGQTLYARSHLKALIRLHLRDPHMTASYSPERRLQGATNQPSGSDAALCADEVVVIEGALDLASKRAEHVMVNLANVYMLEEQQLLTPMLRSELLDRGHSRIPIYRRWRWNVKGLLYIKQLICIDSHKEPSVGHLVRSTRPPIFCRPNMSLYHLLNEFQRGTHMAFVTRDPDWHSLNWGALDTRAEEELPDERALLGIATLEDVIEELIQEEIYDEFDKFAGDQFDRGTPPLKLSVLSAKNAGLKTAGEPFSNDVAERLLPKTLNSIQHTVSLSHIKTIVGLTQARSIRQRETRDEGLNTADTVTIPVNTS